MVVSLIDFNLLSHKKQEAKLIILKNMNEIF